MVRRTGAEREPTGDRLRGTGTEPDPRFTLANERTFLAWIRTSLVLLATGLAVIEFLRSEPRTVRLVIAAPLMLLGALAAVLSYPQWETRERMLRLRRPLPLLPAGRVIAVGVGLTALAATLLVALTP